MFSYSWEFAAIQSTEDQKRRSSTDFERVWFGGDNWKAIDKEVIEKGPRGLKRISKTVDLTATFTGQHDLARLSLSLSSLLSHSLSARSLAFNSQSRLVPDSLDCDAPILQANQLIERSTTG
jgi:hypothetical protein